MKCDLVGIPRLGDKILVKECVHGGYLYLALAELPEEDVSLLEWIDYVIMDEEYQKHISTLEKVVLDDFFGYRGTPYALITFFNPNDSLKNLFGKGLRIWSTDWQPMDFNFEVVEDHPAIDFLFSYSLYTPSRYRPCYRHPDFLFYRGDQLLYYNDLTGGRHRPYIPKLPGDRIYTILFPPSYLGGSIDIYYFYPDSHEEFSVLDKSDKLVVYYLEVLKDLGFQGRIILPLIINEGLRFKGGFIIYEGGEVRYVDDLKYEAVNNVVVTLDYDLKPNKFNIVFKKFRRRLKQRGKTFYLNIGFKEYPPPPSHLFLEFRMDGKIVWSSDSSKGLHDIPLIY